MVYVCSDIHGQWNVYRQIIDRLTESDHLYVLGDVIDRGADGLKILFDIMNRENVTFLMGNHEWFLLASLYYKWEEDTMDIWMQYRNGGTVTVHKFFELEEEKRQRLFAFLLNSPVYLRVEENGKVYHLIHGWYNHQADALEGFSFQKVYEDVDASVTFEDTANFDLLWNSTLKGDSPLDYELQKDEYFIHGHVPVFRMQASAPPSKRVIAPYREENRIFIDGGLTYDGAEILYNLTEDSFELFS
jgi:serine/threonine protein phosphatase 1